MIQLFNINDYVVDTATLGNHLHGKIVDHLVEEVCAYVGAKYGCALNSATNAIFLAFENKEKTVSIPSILPPVVANAILHGGNRIKFVDEVEWVGHSYVLHDFGDYKVIDSAQRMDRNQFKECDSDDLVIFSFYPTKPVGGIDGGIIVSDDKDKIEYLKQRAMNGMSYSENNWERVAVSHGWKMYMNSVQAFVAMQNLKKLDKKKIKLQSIRDFYNKKFALDNTSNHLYRINVPNRDQKLASLRDKYGISCGVHYRALHKMDPYKHGSFLPKSNAESEHTLSIPFHENLSNDELGRVVECISRV